ncbi:penicillin amidase [Bacillus chungangensis]|uniref:Penicillin amidase n=2 Tax=Bacillus chungangensis TaxID=587633 RepID=A0ABT9WTR4_9BACI|nr:penicillin amidase [Bacillus chungangensis]
METMMQPSVAKTKGKKWRKIAIIAAAIFVVLAILLFAFISMYAKRSIPQLEGKITIKNLHEAVEVVRDEKGVPHIKAENDHDLFIAQGYTQAQDRLFQMEMARRQASGTLSEVVGSTALERDKYFRTLGLRRAAEASYDIYSEEAKEILAWFAEGVNAFIEEAAAANRLPIEFTLLRSKPDKWTPIDSLTIGKYMAFDLGGHWEEQAFNYYLLNEFSPEKAYELFPSYPAQAPTIIQEEEIVDVAASFKDAVIPDPFNGSNNWVIAGEKSTSGKPLLADDPHLGLATPSVWYQMHLQSPSFQVGGVIFAGVPGIILGHNDQIAWGVTNTGPDVQQLYLEKRNPDNPNQFLFEEKWEEANVIDEPIHIKGEKTLDYKVEETRHGPVISEFAGDSGKDTVLSLKWTALAPTPELEAIINMNKATNWEEFEKALEKFHTPTQNFLFAGEDGTIAYKANGKIPIYQHPDDALLPLPGWEKASELENHIPFDELPKVVNPSKGFIATANNKVAGDGYPYHLSHVWAQPYRYMRIAEVLEEKEKLSLADMRKLQMDEMNLQAREFVPIFLEQLKELALTKQEKDAVALLEKWDFLDDKDKPQPLLFHKWIADFKTLLFKEDIPEEMFVMFSSQNQVTDELIRKASKGEKSIWIESKGGLAAAVHTSLKNTIEQLTEAYGEDMSAWKWGAFHQIQFEHPLARVHTLLEKVFNKEKPIPVGGSSVTVEAAGYQEDTGIVHHGASWRFVIDMNEPEIGYHIVAPGQSGHFKSEWYADQTFDWVNGDYHKTSLEGAAGKTLVLTP